MIKIIEYKGINPSDKGIIVSKENALNFACERMGIILTENTTDEVKEMIEEWFFSSWLEVEQDENGDIDIWNKGQVTHQTRKEYETEKACYSMHEKDEE